MQKKIGRRMYNTEKADFVGRNAHGYYGDPTGFEEQMYKKGLGDFFLVVSGGPESQYPNEDIIPLDLSDAKEWIERVRGGEIVSQFITEADEAKLKSENEAAVKSVKSEEKKAPAKKAPAKKATTAKKPSAKKTTTKKATDKK